MAIEAITPKLTAKTANIFKGIISGAQEKYISESMILGKPSIEAYFPSSINPSSEAEKVAIRLNQLI